MKETEFMRVNVFWEKFPEEITSVLVNGETVPELTGKTNNMLQRYLARLRTHGWMFQSAEYSGGWPSTYHFLRENVIPNTHGRGRLELY